MEIVRWPTGLELKLSEGEAHSIARALRETRSSILNDYGATMQDALRATQVENESDYLKQRLARGD